MKFSPLTTNLFFLQISLSILIILGLYGCNQVEERQGTQHELAIVVNRSDPLSVQIAKYYQKQRQIPQQNVISINLNSQQVSLSPDVFQRIKAQVDAQTPKRVQGYVLTWIKPYRVGCMSITSAFALGFDPAYCAQGCLPTKANPFFNSDSSQPYKDFGIRPTMMLAATHFNQAKALIERGVASDRTNPPGTAYLMKTTDPSRNVRASFYEQIIEVLSVRIKIEIIKSNSIATKSDVMFYFTGLERVENLSTLKFRPGAIADHLTSFGGQLIDSSQMSSLRWLEAGATGSYGTVVEPCNFPQKFPHPGLVMYYYLRGNTLLNAYWKSVAWPGQGLFIGEPLARPYAKKKFRNSEVQKFRSMEQP